MGPRALLHITGMGMVTALGTDAATSCAAARAGLSRARPWAGYRVTSVEGEDQGLVCHTAPLITAGFGAALRVSRLMELALRDLLSQQAWLATAEGIACYLALPASLFPDAGEGEGTARLARALWDQAAHAAGWRPSPPPRFLSVSGHAGFAQALRQAAVDLQAGAVRAALLVAADSLIDAARLSALEEAGRLKTPAMPSGLQPGEGAAALVMELDTALRQRGGTSGMVVRGLGFGQDPHTALDEQPPIGRGTAEALQTLLKQVHFAHQLPLWCLSDHTGETWRAMDWGGAQVLLSAHGGDGLISETIYPAASFGDTGAASAALAVCQAAIAFARGYAPGPLAAVLSAGEGGDRAALLCQAA